MPQFSILLHLLLRFGQHPELMVIIIAVVLQRLCWCSLTPAPQTLGLFNQACFLLRSRNVGVGAISRGQDHTEGPALPE